MHRVLLGVVIASGCLLVACGKPAPPSESQTSAAPASAPQSAAATPAELFPPGPGREWVLGTCGACHAVGCSAQGQRTQDQWATLKADHMGKLTGASKDEIDTMFAYLSSNFNNTKPEPPIPEAYAGPCTPY